MNTATSNGRPILFASINTVLLTPFLFVGAAVSSEFVMFVAFVMLLVYGLSAKFYPYFLKDGVMTRFGRYLGLGALISIAGSILSILLIFAGIGAGFDDRESDAVFSMMPVVLMFCGSVMAVVMWLATLVLSKWVFPKP